MIPRSRTPPSGPLAVLVPLKDFSTAKERLGTSVNQGDRSALMQNLAAGVLGAVPSEVRRTAVHRWVVCDDPAVARFALTCGAQVLWRGGGLNPAVQSAVRHLEAAGITRVVVVHGDLSRPHQLTEVITIGIDPPTDSVVIVPDRHRRGTNVLSVPSGRGFAFGYGSDSFDRHRSEAARLNLPILLPDLPALGLDIDTLDDLAIHRDRPRRTPLGGDPPR